MVVRSAQKLPASASAVDMGSSYTVDVTATQLSYGMHDLGWWCGSMRSTSESAWCCPGQHSCGGHESLKQHSMACRQQCLQQFRRQKSEIVQLHPRWFWILLDSAWHRLASCMKQLALSLPCINVTQEAAAVAVSECIALRPDRCGGHICVSVRRRSRGNR